MFDTPIHTRYARGLGNIPCRAEIEEMDSMQEAFEQKREVLRALEKKTRGDGRDYRQKTKGEYNNLQENTEFVERDLSNIKRSIEVYKDGIKKYREYILKLENALNVSSLGFPLHGTVPCGQYTRRIEDLKNQMQLMDGSIFHLERNIKQFEKNIVSKEVYQALYDRKNQMEVEYRELTEQVFKPLQEENRVLSEQYKALKDKLIASGATGSDIDYILKKPLPPEAKQVLTEETKALEEGINSSVAEVVSQHTSEGSKAKASTNKTLFVGVGAALFLGFLIYKKRKKK